MAGMKSQNEKKKEGGVGEWWWRRMVIPWDYLTGLYTLPVAPLLHLSAIRQTWSRAQSPDQAPPAKPPSYPGPHLSQAVHLLSMSGLPSRFAPQADARIRVWEGVGEWRGGEIQRERERERERERVCVCVCVTERERVCVCVCVRACARPLA